MITLEFNPQMKTTLPNRQLNWTLVPAKRTYTYEEVCGSLSAALEAALESSPIEADPIPDVAPEDFETIYNWFIA